MLLGPLVVLALFSGLESHPAPVISDGNSASACQKVRDLLSVIGESATVPSRCLAEVVQDPLNIVEDMSVPSKCTEKIAQFIKKECYISMRDSLDMCFMMNEMYFSAVSSFILNLISWKIIHMFYFLGAVS